MTAWIGQRIDRSAGAAAWDGGAPTSSSGWALVGPGALLLCALASAVLPGSVVDAVGWGLLGVGLLVVGLPHGAVDHLVPGWVAGRRGGGPSLGVLVAGYVAVAAAGTALFLSVPAVGLALFLALTVAHWGQGERWACEELNGRARPAVRWSALAATVARGTLPVVGPLALRPDAAASALGELSGTSAAVSVASDPLVRGALAVGLLVGVALWLAATLRDHEDLRAAGARRDALELGCLLVAAATAPPVLVVATYYLAWHAARHVARLAALHPSTPRGDRSSQAVGAVLRAAGPCTLVAAGGMVALAALASGRDRDAEATVAAAFAVTFGLTLPHAVVVLWMDRTARSRADAGPGRTTRRSGRWLSGRGSAAPRPAPSRSHASARRSDAARRP